MPTLDMLWFESLTVSPPRAANDAGRGPAELCGDGPNAANIIALKGAVSHGAKGERRWTCGGTSSSPR